MGLPLFLELRTLSIVRLGPSSRQQLTDDVSVTSISRVLDEEASPVVWLHALPEGEAFSVASKLPAVFPMYSGLDRNTGIVIDEELSVDSLERLTAEHHAY